MTPMVQRSDKQQFPGTEIAVHLSKPIRRAALLEALLTALGHTAPERDPTLSKRPPETRSPSAYHPRILLAEDNVVNQKVAARMLENLGYRVDVVANGQEALTAAAQIPYACILMDCQMPEMDGYTATRAIREREARLGGRIPIIAMTANAMPGDRERCLAAGMDDYLGKPVHPEDLRAVLHRWLSQPMHVDQVETRSTT
jgi:CheY-like chemotaxis protein